MVKKRKPNMAKPNVAKLRERMQKKIYPAAGKDSWSNNKYKEHCSDVVGLYE